MSVQQLKAQTGLEKTKPIEQRSSLVVEFGNRYSIDPARVVAVLKATVFDANLSLEEMQAGLIVAKNYNLNPFTKEIYAFKSGGKLLIIVGVDGWSTIVNRQAQLDGIEFSEGFDQGGKIASVTCKIHRKDRKLPTVITEYYAECKRETAPWKQSPIRMLRHKAFIQCARIAFSISGIVDEDEAGRMPNGPMIEAQIERAASSDAPLIEYTAPTAPWSTRASELFDRLQAPEDVRRGAWEQCGRNDAELVTYLEGMQEAAE